jgi:hypothetical protein
MVVMRMLRNCQKGAIVMITNCSAFRVEGGCAKSFDEVIQQRCKVTIRASSSALAAASPQAAVKRIPQ